MRLEHVQFRVEQQIAHSRALSLAIDNLLRSPVTKERIDVRMQAVQDQWDTFNAFHQAITLAVSRLPVSEQQLIREHAYFGEDCFSSTHECYLETIAKLSTLSGDVDSRSRRSSPVRSISQAMTTTSRSQGPRLPRINLPKFNGDLAAWLPFKDLFVSLVIENPSLSSVEKLQYLQTSLTGSASMLLVNTALTADNFQRAWDALLAFYENDRLLTNAALQELFSLKKMSKESATEMESLYTSIMQCYRSFEALKRPVTHWDDILVYLTVQRFDAESVKAWENHLGSSRIPATWHQLREFMMTRLVSLRAFEKSLAGPTTLSHTRLRFARSHSASVKPAEEREIRQCPLCNDSHYIGRCSRFQKETPMQRGKLVAAHKLCYNCLGDHFISKCPSSKRCIKCGKRHHSLLHRPPTSNSRGTSSKESSDSASVPSIIEGSQRSDTESFKAVLHAQTAAGEPSHVVLLATAKVKIHDNNNQVVYARVLLDQGSEVSLVTERLVHQLRLPREASLIRLFGVGKSSTGKTRGAVSLTLRPHFPSAKEISLKALVLPKLTTVSPPSSVEHSHWPHLRNLLLADPDFFRPGPIDIIIGAEMYGQLLEGPLIKGPPDAPTAQLTKFGWALSGPVSNSTTPLSVQSHHYSVDHDLLNLLERFWIQEEVKPSTNGTLSAIDEKCEEHFLRTHTRAKDGRYIVRMPVQTSLSHLGDSRPAAQRMLTHLDRRFGRDVPYAQAYSKFLQEYETLNHMVRIADDAPQPNRVFYLPHHGVIRETSTTTKLRVVFNGSCVVENGLSLNELLCTGPKLQTDIIDVLLWFRQFRFVFSCDIEKMYRQIAVHPEDQPLQRILWKEGSKIIQFQLTTVTYGLACAPYLALKAVQQLTKDEGEQFPGAVDPLQRGRYVDDIYGGADSVELARDQLTQVNKMCLAGGFPLRKWTSNDPSVLLEIPQEHRSQQESIKIEDSVVHALGLSWNTATDMFQFRISNFPPGPLTKRLVLSRVAQFFDPLGLLSPVIIRAKIFLQELWAVKLSWDTPLPSTQCRLWQDLSQAMSGLEDIQIPRWLGKSLTNNIEIHGFCDASQLAMAAAVYLRTEDHASLFRVSLVCSKTKVAPLKRMTIPRLELSSAVLLTRLISHVVRVLQLQDSPCHLWTDSSIVLTWLTNHPSRWKDFVHNRVCFIQETLPQAQWHHIPGLENPADCASRGVSATTLKDHNLWWAGPAWLSKSSSEWPVSTLPTTEKTLSLEERKTQRVSLHLTQREPNDSLILRYSSLNRLLRITAILKRVLRRSQRHPRTSLTYPLTPDEVLEAQKIHIRTVQRASFHGEINLLKAQKYLPRSNPLSKLCPFFDKDDLLRLRGRLEHARLDVNAKHPYILPRESAFSTLVIRDAHERTMHGSTQDTLTYVRNTFWIIGGRAPVRSHILKCIRCTRYRRIQAQQLMGQLPPSRVNPSRAFLNTGIDYAGPYQLRSWKRKGARIYKSWIALFVCLSTSAIHIELVTDYTTEAFIAAYHRFTSRRGICATLTSDCGTNFKGADLQLRKLFSATSTELHDLATLIARDGTKWIFNPPAAPHFGGKWEAGVKSLKFHLRRVLGETILTYEEMCTLLSKVEAVLNSRPLCPLTDDPDDLEVLTPGHFLIGHSLSLIPEPNLTTVNPNRLQRWQHCSQMLQAFWQKWSRGYLQRFQAIYKWNRSNLNLGIGTLVLITDERYPPAKWPLGRIVETHPGKDNIVRVVSVKTSTSIIKRPIVKLCPLYLDDPTK